jgi:hypothetical protein
MFPTLIVVEIKVDSKKWHARSRKMLVLR